MDNKRIVEALNSCIRYGGKKELNVHCWSELILLYEDGTWEKIFEYRWPSPFSDIKRINTGRLKNLTRKEAIVKLEKDYYAGKIIGIFMD